MEEHKSASAVSDVKMQSTASANVSAQKQAAATNANLPNSTSNIEEDWRRLK